MYIKCKVILRWKRVLDKFCLNLNNWMDGQSWKAYFVLIRGRVIPVRGGEEGEGVTDTDTQEKSEGAWLGRREESLSEGISEMNEQ